MRAVVLLVAACGSNAPVSGDAAGDAPPAPVCDGTDAYTPFAISGTSPAGSLDGYRFVRAGHTEGDCPDAYVINFATSAQDPSCTGGPTLSFIIPAPFDRASIQTIATVSSPTYVTTNQVMFDVTQLDEPTAPSPRIDGHLVSHDPAWRFDIAVDLTSQYNASCI